jgi:hypothetical protein
MPATLPGGSRDGNRVSAAERATPGRFGRGPSGHRAPVLLKAAQRLRVSRTARVAARGGLVARAGFYLLLGYLAAGIALGWGRSSTPANAHGALTTVAGQPGGRLALAGAAVGFAAFALVRLAGAYADRRVGRWRRVSTAGQAVVYLAMSGGVVAFLVGDRSTGSARQQDSTAAQLVSSTPGRLVMAVAGIVVVAVCVWQLRLAVQGGYADSLSTHEMSERARAVWHWVARVGIVARAAAVMPVGGLLVLAAVRAKPGESRDLDQLLDALARDPVGRPLVFVAAVGFAVFAVYTVVEVRYRRVEAGD